MGKTAGAWTKVRPMKSIYEASFPELFRFIREDKLPVRYFSEKRLFALRLEDAGPVYQEIRFCPWSGKQLPKPLTDEFIALLTKMNLSALEPETLPPEFRTEQWWIERGL